MIKEPKPQLVHHPDSRDCLLLRHHTATQETRQKDTYLHEPTYSLQHICSVQLYGTQ